MGYLDLKRKPINGNSYSYRVLQEAEHAWTQMSGFRKNYARCMAYTHGRQWDDMIPVGHGRYAREKDVLLKEGQAGIVQNMIGKTVNVVQGLFINQNSEQVCVARDRDEQQEAEGLTTLLQYTNDINEGTTYYPTIVKTATISGAAVCRERYTKVKGRIDCWSLPVNLHNFFVDTNMSDPRTIDCTLVGEIHDYNSIDDLLAVHARNEKHEQNIRKMYTRARDDNNLTLIAHQFGARKHINSSFLIPSDFSCRVIEVWKLEHQPRYHFVDRLDNTTFKCKPEDKKELVDMENQKRLQEGLAMGVAEEEVRSKLIEPLPNGEDDENPTGWFYDDYWYYRFYAPTGEIIDEGETPYAHGEHPFVMMFYPFVNGEVHSFVSDMIDTQRYINRLINLNDFILRTSAKGLLAIPDTALEGTGMTIEDIADVWAKPSGVYVYHPKAGVDSLPHQISSQTQLMGVTELIQMEKAFFDDISGVNAALQGKSVGSVSGSYYAQQTQNSAVSLQGLLTMFNGFFKKVAEKRCQNIQQYYDEQTILDIVGRDGIMNTNVNPRKIKNLKHDISIAESQATPAFRQMAQDFLMQACANGWISFNTLLETGNVPYADKIKQLTETEKQRAMEEQQAMAQQQQLNEAGGQAPEDPMAEEEVGVPYSLREPINPAQDNDYKNIV